jgi:hypothetical protein
MNLSWGKALNGTDTLNGNSLLTSGTDYLSQRYDTLDGRRRQRGGARPAAAV